MISTYPHEQLGCFPRQAAEMGHTCMVDDSSATLGKRWGSSLIRNKKSPIHCDCHSIFIWYITFYIFVYIYIYMLGWYGMVWYGMVWYGMVCIFWADAHRRLRRNTRPSISLQCGLWKLLNEDLLVGNRRFFGSKWVPESSCEGFFLKNCCQFQRVTSCKGASVQRLLCVKAFVCKSFRV